MSRKVILLYCIFYKNHGPNINKIFNELILDMRYLYTYLDIIYINVL